MVVLAIDVGYRLGYALARKPNELIEYGTMYFKPDTKRDHLVYQFLKEKIKQADLVVVEQFRFYKQAKAGHTTPELIGMIKSLCIEYNKEYEVINYNRWKKEFRNLYSTCYKILPDNWKQALEKGSEHSRDAVAIAFVYVISPTLLKLRRKGQ